jgi:hypothetical protein
MLLASITLAHSASFEILVSYCASYSGRVTLSVYPLLMIFRNIVPDLHRISEHTNSVRQTEPP